MTGDRHDGNPFAKRRSCNIDYDWQNSAYVLILVWWRSKWSDCYPPKLLWIGGPDAILCCRRSLTRQGVSTLRGGSSKARSPF